MIILDFTRSSRTKLPTYSKPQRNSGTFLKNSGATAPTTDPPTNLPGPGAPVLQLPVPASNQGGLQPIGGSKSSTTTTSAPSSKTFNQKEKKLGSTVGSTFKNLTPSQLSFRSPKSLERKSTSRLYVGGDFPH